MEQTPISTTVVPFCRFGFFLIWFLVPSTLTFADSLSVYPARDSALLKKFAPVFYQHVKDKNRYDLITRVDFDGNFDAGDNSVNALEFDLPAYVYAEVVAETKDTYYLTYNVYHPMDWQGGIFGKLPAQSHQNDFEGVILAVGKLFSTD